MSNTDEPPDRSNIALEVTEVATPAAGGEGGASRAGARLERGAMLGRYRIAEFVGGGGMGWVYRARDTELERDVAIKVLRPGLAGAKGRERLLAEARAMAKLQHRAVVPVYDVGEHGDGVYVAMALVTGGTLHDWIHARPRPWREVVSKFIEAGRGLEAAHAAGLVHRDFKPRNVLLGGTGEVQVADFGIASASVTADGEGSGDASTIVGTPAYMAPEQASGKTVDARADQFSFCVSLWEGLHGQRPQEAETRTAGGVIERATDTPRTRRRVPGWLTAAVARGFAPPPERRWPTMQALLDALERGLGRRRRSIFGAAAFFVVVAGVSAYALLRPAAGDPCLRGDASVRRAWGAVTRMVVAAAMREAAPALAEDTLQRTDPVLAHYADDLSVAMIDACRIERRDRDVHMAALRAACLEERVTALRNAVEGLARPKLESVLQAVAVVSQLPDIPHCSDTGRLAQLPPMSAMVKGRYDAVAAKIDEVNALISGGNYGEAASAARAVLDEARQVGYAPLTARALRSCSIALFRAGEDTTEIDRELTRVAAEAHDDTALALAWTSVVADMVNEGGDPAAAAALLPVVDAAIERAGGARTLRYRGAMSAGIVASAQRRSADAVAAFEKAGQLARTPLDRSEAKANVMVAYVRAGNGRAAVEAGQQALDVLVEALGSKHPNVALARARLARRKLNVGDIDGAAADVEAARVALASSFGESVPWLVEVYDVSAELAAQRGDHVSELRERRRLLELDRLARPGQRPTCERVNNLASALAENDQFREAEPLFREALECLRAARGGDSAQFGLGEATLGQHLVAAKRCEDARPLLEHAKVVLAARPQVVVALVALADCDFGDGRREAAYAAGEQALSICERAGCPANVTLMITAQFGGWLFKGGASTRARGAAMIRKAAAAYDALGDHVSARKVEAELAAHVAR